MRCDICIKSTENKIMKNQLNIVGKQDGCNAQAAKNEAQYCKMRKRIKQYSAKICDERIKNMFERCFYSSLDSAAERLDDGTTFMLTGDIPAMWLRDSAVQVMGYLPFVKLDEDVDGLVRGLLKRQFDYIALDPYANAFNREPNNHGHKDDVTNSDSPWIWERKYEVDSLCYPLWLAQKYTQVTNDFSVYDSKFITAFTKILDTFEVEQYHSQRSQYIHSRPKYPQFPTLTNNGKGEAVGYTGMTWNGYRPSDDVCTFGYLVPSNQFAVVVLSYILTNIDAIKAGNLTDRVSKLLQQIKQGIAEYGIVNSKEFGKMYAYEVDGLGGINLMDDANVPSLISLPYLGYCDISDPIYQNTRKFALSNQNPYYYSGKFGKGIGSPHTPNQYIWHIGLIMQLLTSDNKAERKEIFSAIISTDADCGVMHEAFDCNNPKDFTREWFCWANTLFAMAVMSMLDNGEL